MSNRTKRKGQTPTGQRPQQQNKPRPAQAQTQPRPPQPQRAQPPPPRAIEDTAQIAAKREARLNKQAVMRAAGERRRRAKAIRRYGIIGAIVVVLLGVFLALYIRELNKPGESVPAMPTQNHLGANQVASTPYNTDPPTSGDHFEGSPAFKIYTEPMTKELTVHGLEDGGVVMNYQPELDKAVVDKLAAVATSYFELEGGRSHVIMAPYPGLSHPIVLTAWRRIDRLNEFDEPRIRRFVDEYVGIDHHKGREGQRIP